MCMHSIPASVMAADQIDLNLQHRSSDSIDRPVVLLDNMTEILTSRSSMPALMFSVVAFYSCGVPQRMMSRSKWLPLTSINVASSFDYSAEAYAIRAGF